MNNPFDNVPSAAKIPESIDKKTVSTLTNLVDRLEKSVERKEAIVKNEEELAGVIFNLLLDDDGSVKDSGHTAEIRELIDDTRKNQDRSNAFLAEILKSIPRSIKAELGEEDHKRFDFNFKSWKDMFQLYLPTFGIVGAIAGIVLTGSIMLSKSAADTRHQYEQRISRLDRWYEDNADVIAFGQFYRETIPRNTVNGIPANGNRTSPTASPSAVPTPSTA